MGKKTLLYASPMPPMKSGISDYSEILVYALKEYFDITLFIDDYRLDNKQLYKDFEVVVFGKDRIDFEQYDYIIYNIGNNPEFHSYIYEVCLKHPGMVILHEFVLYYLFVGYYQKKGNLYNKIYEDGGVDAINIIKQAMKHISINLLECKKIAEKLPLHKELLKSDNKFMVHSQYAYDHIIDQVKDKNNVRKINLIDQIEDNAVIVEKDKLFEKYKIPKDAILITSFGYISETKLNHKVCEAVTKLQQEVPQKLCYVMVGEGNYVDSMVDSKTIIKTGYVELDEMNSFIKYSDVVTNLRHPSMGETSAALLRIMAMGKPCVVCNEAWFSELPNDCVLKLDYEDVDEKLVNVLKDLLLDKELRDKISKKSVEYVEEKHGKDVVAKEIKDYLMME